MPALAITGTIGSGKSSVLRTLGAQLRAKTFSADEENHRLLNSDAEVRDLICSQFGKSFYLKNGNANRRELLTLIQNDPSARSALEFILHPRLQALWKPMAEKFRNDYSSYFIAEIPLLYEKQLDLYFDKVIVVGCSDSVRRERLDSLRSIPPSETAAWLAIQVSQDTKITKSDYLLWNDGSEAQLLWQTNHLASHFLRQ